MKGLPARLIGIIGVVASPMKSPVGAQAPAGANIRIIVSGTEDYDVSPTDAALGIIEKRNRNTGS